MEDTQGDITFSDFKKEKGSSVYYFADSILRYKAEKNKKFLKPREVYFDIPYRMRAQNSWNREGYGWEWDWSYGIGISTEGTFYGETDDYVMDLLE